MSITAAPVIGMLRAQHAAGNGKGGQGRKVLMSDFSGKTWQREHAWKIFRCRDTGRITETPMVRKLPISDMKYARNGTYLAAARQRHASSVRTTNLLTPAGTPACIKTLLNRWLCHLQVS
jgi:hypothetical protein